MKAAMHAKRTLAAACACLFFAAGWGLDRAFDIAEVGSQVPSDALRFQR